MVSAPPPLLPLAPALRVSDHMDLGPSELVGRSCYQFVHGQDAARIRQSHLDRENPYPCLPAPQTRVPPMLCSLEVLLQG